MVYRNVCKAFKEARLEIGMTQRELATRIGYDGKKAKQFVSNWERCLCSPPPKKWYKMCKILNVSPEIIGKQAQKDLKTFLKGNKI